MNKSKVSVITDKFDEFDKLLADAIEHLNIKVNDDQRLKLLLYLDKLLFWNKAYNLTAIKQPKDALIKHIFDSLSVLPYLQAGALLDIGTGAGLPGVVIAICQPERQVTVLDSNQKKIRFIKQCIAELDINNVTPVASRIENFTPVESKFMVVTSRAFASLADFVDVSACQLAQGGYLQAMKGHAPKDADIAPLLADWHIDITALTVPNLNESRHLVTLYQHN